MISVTSIALAASGAMLAANAATGGPNYVGIAALIAACASAFGTVVAGVITILRFLRTDEPITPDDVGEAVEAAVAKALKQQDLG